MTNQNDIQQEFQAIGVIRIKSEKRNIGREQKINTPITEQPNNIKTYLGFVVCFLEF
jgi:hypothetical protein